MFNRIKKSICLSLILIFSISIFSIGITGNAEESALPGPVLEGDTPEETPVKIATAVVSDIVKGKIKVSGTLPSNSPGKSISILALNPDGNVNSAETNESMIQYQGSAITDESGYFEKTFQLLLGKEFVDGTFKVYVGGEGFVTPEEHSVYYVSMEKKIQIAKDICKAETTKEDIVSLISNNAKALAVDNDAVTGIDLMPLAIKLKEVLSDNPISFNDEEQGLLDLQTLILKLAVLECFNQSKSTVIYNDDGTFRYDDVIGLTQAVQDGTTLIPNYNNDITELGKSEIRQGLMGQSCADLTQLQKLFAKLIIINGIKNNKLSGYGFVSDYLTEQNAAFAELSIPEYLSLSSKSAANSNISKNSSSLTIDNLAKKIEEYSKEDTSSSSSSSSDRGSGSKGKGGFSAPAGPIKSDNSSAFTDIGNYAWASEAIEHLHKKGIVNGISEGIFAPAKNLTREEAAKILCLAFNIELDNEASGFEDVNENSWYAKYVAGAKRAGVIYGISAKEFGVGKNITRQDFAVMIYRVLSPVPSGAVSEFTDSSNISDYAVDAVNYLKQKNILNGYEDGSFKPKNCITRAEMAKILFLVITKGE